MKILLLGAPGQVGFELAPLLSKRGELVLPTRDEVDMTRLDSVRDVMIRERPALVVNATAYNEVDRAESEPEAALRVNAEAVAVLGELAKAQGAALIHYSTDFVFDGTKGAPYVESDATHPLSAYGRSKLRGEQLLAELDAPAITLRTAWVCSLRRKSFVSVMLKLAREREEMKIVTDQIGSPTAAFDLAHATSQVVDFIASAPHERATALRGVYHAAGQGACSRYELARAALELDPRSHEHKAKRFEGVLASAFPAPAARPAYSALDCSRLREVFGAELLPWKEALRQALQRG